MAVGRVGRRSARRGRVAEVFTDEHVDRALDLLELVELAWHDCYAEVSPPETVIDQILVVSQGDLGALIAAGRLAVTDRRDLQLAAEALGSPDDA